MRVALVSALVLVPGLGFGVPRAREVDDLPLPALERTPELAASELPPVPGFELPAQEPGFVDPQYLRVRGKALLGTDVKVKGYITWIYDCIADVRHAKESRRQTQQRIDADPTLCERPKLYLGSKRQTPPERALWVVDVPRPPNKLEKERLPEEELAAWPAVPKLKLGQYVVVAGTFATESTHHERNSDGLLLFASVEPAKPRRSVARPARPSPPSVVTLAAAHEPTAAAMRDVVDQKVVNVSMLSLATANRAAANQQLTTAIEYYRRAVASWRGNHIAWYGLGGAAARQGDWATARDAFEHAAKLRPDAAMYQMWLGIARYHAQKSATSPAYDSARASLEAAIVIEPALWRAHYYLGRIYREADDAKLAAESFTRAILADGHRQGPYIALAELYRKWDYTDEAIAVAALGGKELPASVDASERSDVFYVLGVAQHDRHSERAAIAAFTRALELQPDNHKARFQRGEVYYRMHRFADAKRDLEAFVAAGASNLAFARRQAEVTLAKIAAKRP